MTSLLMLVPTRPTNQQRAYTDLPLKTAEFTALHRNEASGALSGLTRVRQVRHVMMPAARMAFHGKAQPYPFVGAHHRRCFLPSFTKTTPTSFARWTKWMIRCKRVPIPGVQHCEETGQKMPDIASRLFFLSTSQIDDCLDFVDVMYKAFGTSCAEQCLSTPLRRVSGYSLKRLASPSPRLLMEGVRVHHAANAERH